MGLKTRIPYFLSTAALIFSGAITPTNAEEEDPFEGSYFCVADAAGGVSFDDALNKWDSTRFKTGERYVVNVARHSKTENWLGELRTVYTVQVHNHGSGESDALLGNCRTNNPTLHSYNPITHFISEAGELSCRRLGGDWMMNLKNGRFMNTYVWGYLDGIDNNSNTPNIEIGTCSRIN